ncbi:cleavage and polyadenylation specificity factor subunit 1-like isoform X2 [Amphiura filiformis]
MPVPKPIGGVLIMAVNSLLYLNQSVPPFGVSLNSITDRSTSFPMKVQEGVKLSLDCSHAIFISYDRLVVSLKGGEIYVLTLLVDGMRSVRGFHFDKAAASVLTTCLCLMEEGFLFLGSRLGNSLLLKYTEKMNDKLSDGTNTASKPIGEEWPASKRRRGEDASDWMASDVTLVEDPDELEVYGKEEKKSGTQLTSYSFEVCDSLLNIGPCSNMVMGEPAFLSEEFQNNLDPDLELVTCSGYGKNGALSVLERTVRPQVVTTFELPGCYDMWTVVGKIDNVMKPPGVGDEEGEKEPPKESEQLTSHAFLLLSRDDSTMILQTGKEITELDHSGYSTQGPTVFAGNLGNNKYAIQVTNMGVRLLEGVNQQQHIPLDLGAPITQCSLADPYVILMSEKGDVMLLTLKKSDQHGERLAITRPQMLQKSKILALSTYKDTSGMFAATSKKPTGPQKQVDITPEKEPRPSTSSKMYGVDVDNIDEEDEMLYGSSEPAVLASNVPSDTSPKSGSSKEADKTMSKEPTYWCTVCRENGLLEIYSLPDFNLAFVVRNFPMAQKVLVDSGHVQKTSDQPHQQHEMLPTVKEVLLLGLGNKNSRPFLMAIVEDDLLIYEAFPAHSTKDDSHLKIRFKKVSHNILMKVKKGKSKKQSKTSSNLTLLGDTEDEQGKKKYINRMRYFQDISSYSGVFISGPYPYWVFLTNKGVLRAHPMPIDGAVTCFAPFNNVNCPKGFLYFNKQGELRICVLPTHLSYDSPWPVRKVPLRCTPHFVSYHVETKTYSVVTSTLTAMTSIPRFNGEEKEEEEIERDERFIHSNKEQFSIQLFSPLSWEPIPNTKIDYEEYEHVTCLKSVNLLCESTVTGRKGYLAIATTSLYGEDIQTKGRICIYDVIEVVPEPGQPLTKNNIKVLYDKEQKGPVSCLCDVMGYLLSCVGQKIYLWTFKDNDLIGLAFVDTQIYIHNAVSIKNFVLVSDISKSVYLLQYQVQDRTLALVSRDPKPLEVYSCEFMVDDKMMAFLVSDADKNLILYHYYPNARESFGGTRLLRRADMNIGAHVNTFVRVRCKLTDPATDKPSGGPVERRHAVFMATLDGGLGLLLPMTEKIYRRLFMLQNGMTSNTPHVGGLNPRAYRQIVSPQRALSNPHKNILDGDLLWKFTHLGVVEKNELAKKIGTTVEQIMDDLMDVERLTMHF